jgi:hypothetical protein
MAKKPFQPGVSANPRGRPKGSVNKFTTLKQAFLSVFERMGGEDELLKWAQESNRNKATFYQWITKMLPADVNLGNVPGENGKPQSLLIEVVHVKGPDKGNGNGNGNGKPAAT